MVRNRQPRNAATPTPTPTDSYANSSKHAPFLPSIDSLRTGDQNASSPEPSSKMSITAFLHRQPVWLLLAVASGSCAAFNGVFAKL